MILLVDDDPDFIQIIRSVLARDGYRIVAASGPDEAIERLGGVRPHLIITDLMMQTLDAGFSLARRVKDDDRLADIPVIIVTGISSHRGLDFLPRDGEDLAAMHADAFFEKPVEADALRAKVRELLLRVRRPDGLR